MKKFIAIFLTAVMVLSLTPLAIFASDTNPVKIVDANGNAVATYATLIDAVKVVADGQKIIVTDDITSGCIASYGTYNASDLRDIVIEGAEKADGTKVKITATSTLFDVAGLYNLTLRNLEIDREGTNNWPLISHDPWIGGFVDNYASSTLTIDNCYITTDYGVIRFHGGKTQQVHEKYNVLIKDSTIQGKTKNDQAMFHGNMGACIDMDIQNSTITLIGDTATTRSYPYVFCYMPGAIPECTFDLSIDGTSKIITRNASNETLSAGILNVQNGTANVTLANGAELYMDNAEHKTTNYFATGAGAINITDNGAVWKVSATTAKNLVFLPTISGEAWSVNGQEIGSPYSNGNATSDIVFTHSASATTSVAAVIKVVDAAGADVATYATLQEAYNALANGQKIVITNDMDIPNYLGVKTIYDKNNLRNIVIEGAERADGSRVTVTLANGLTDQLGLYNLTVRNLNIISTNSSNMDVFMYDPYCPVNKWVADYASPTLNIENCFISSERSIFKFTADNNGAAVHNPFIVNIDNSTLVCRGAAEQGLATTTYKDSGAVDMTVNNSNLILTYGGTSSSNPEFNYVFAHTPGNAGDIFDLEIIGNSRIVSNCTNSANATGGIFYNLSGTANVTIGEDVELYVNSGAAKTQNTFFRGTVALTDNGAIYKASASTVKNGITLPTFVDGEGNNHLWMVNGEAVANPYTNANATADTVFSHFESSDPSLDPSNVAYAEDKDGNKTYYTSVNSALAGAPSGSTIVLLKDSSYTGHGTFTSKSLTVDGRGFTLTTSGGYTFDVCGSANNTFTVKNLNVNSARFIYNEFSNVNVENCVVNDSYGLIFSIVYASGTDGVINIKDTTINLNTTNNEPFAKIGGGVTRDCDVTFNLENSKINMKTSKAADGGDNARGCFNLLSCGTITVNVDATSSLTMGGDYMRSMFYGHDAGKLALNLADGAVIAMNNCAPGAVFVTSDMYDSTTITDNGADWVIGDAAATAGVYLPVLGKAGETVIGYVKDGKLYNAYTKTAGTYKASDFLNVAAFTASDYDMIDGASLRTIYTENGLRFTTYASDELLAILAKANGYEFHTLIASVDKLGEAALTKDIASVGDNATAVDVKSTKTHKGFVNNDNTYDNAFHAAVIMPEGTESYTLSLAGRGYFTVTYADGTTADFYTAFDSTNNVRSMYDVAVNLQAAGKTNAVVDAVIAACAPQA